MSDYDIVPIQFNPEDLEFLHIREFTQNQIAWALRAPTDVLGPSLMRQVYEAHLLEEYVTTFTRALLNHYKSTLIAWFEETYLRLDLDAYEDYLATRRWEGYLARQFRRQPGFRFADLMQGIERN